MPTNVKRVTKNAKKTNKKVKKQPTSRAKVAVKKYKPAVEAVISTSEISMFDKNIDTFRAEKKTLTPMKALLLAGKELLLPNAPKKDKTGWSEQRRRYLLNYLSKLQMTMRLADWEIIVNFEHVADDDCVAEIKPVENQRRAELIFSKEFFLTSSVDQRQTLVHELLHLHLVHVEQMSLSAVEAAAGEQSSKAFDGAFNCEVERTVDQLADVIAPLLDRFDLPSR
ncbi:MAG: hypothetical protein ACKOW9_05135 [Candidatus Paceibacterota bacterium]